LRARYRELRLQLAAASREQERQQKLLTQASALRNAEAYARPTATVQTDFVSMILPLPRVKG